VDNDSILDLSFDVLFVSENSVVLVMLVAVIEVLEVIELIITERNVDGSGGGGGGGDI
jgi:hypothetical protein